MAGVGAKIVVTTRQTRAFSGLSKVLQGSLQSQLEQTEQMPERILDGA
jgi:hypothetical protein